MTDELLNTFRSEIPLPDEAAARSELASLGATRPAADAARANAAGAGAGRGRSVPAAAPPRAQEGRSAGHAEVLLATWHNLLDVGRMQDGEPNLAGTARPAVARMSAATAAAAGVTAGAKVSVATSRGAISVPVEITAMPDRVVWLPTNSAGCSVRRDLAAGHGSVVTVSAPGGLARDEPPARRSAE